jgi:hypothetical protein
VTQVAAAAEEVVVIVALADTVAFPVTMVAMMLGAIMAKPVEKERSATEMVPLGTGVAYSAAEWQRRMGTVAAKTEAARRRLLAMQTRLVMACINNTSTC